MEVMRFWGRHDLVYFLSAIKKAPTVSSQGLIIRLTFLKLKLLLT